ncbi:hypothetical protein SNEBB_011104 [Seison nebaliae]|nr:hypothetical protein SNEBB_011104 [Seison nebaliae]
MLVRFSIQSSNDDRHIWDILLAKFTNFQTFHTKLYLCAKEFDFLPKQTLIDLSISLLIPLASLTLLIILYFISKNFFGARQISENIHNYSNENVKERKEKEKKVVENHVFPLSLMLLLFQTIFHTIMALFIMRLQLFWTPTICIVAALFFLLPFYFMNHNRHIIYLLGGLMIWPCIVGSSNLKKLTAYHNSYENPEMEELFNWVNENTEKNAIFAGSMNVMANLKLSTNRRLFNHPHYENVQLRNRTYHLYKFYGLNTDVNKWVQLLRENHVNYFIADIARCQMPNKQTDCTLADMYLIDDYELSEEVNMKLVQLEQLLCFRLINRPKHLKQYKIHLKFTSSKSSHMVFEIH